MPSYAIPISTALIVFAVIAFLGTVPWTIYQYRKHGYFSFWRNVIIFSFIYYGLTAFFLVSLPLPKERNNAIVFNDHIYTQLKPFNMFHNFKEVSGFEASNIKTYPTLFKSFTFLEVFFNIALLFPLGVYLRYFLKTFKKWPVALLIIFSTTLFFEVSQLTALFGYYAHPYRLFDVDDLLTNTLGGLLGFLAAPLFLIFIPSRDDLKEKDETYDVDKVASYGAQLIEVFVSLAVARFVGSVMSLLIFKGNYLFISNTVAIFLVIVLYPLFKNCKKIGGAFVKIKLSFIETGNFLPLLYRFFLLITPSLVSQVAMRLNQTTSENIYVLSSQIIFFLSVFLIWLFVWFTLIRDWVKKREEPFFNRMVSLKLIRYEKRNNKRK